MRKGHTVREIVCDAVTMSPSESQPRRAASRRNASSKFIAHQCPPKLLFVFLFPLAYYLLTSIPSAFQAHVLNPRSWVCASQIYLEQLSPTWARLPVSLSSPAPFVSLRQGVVSGKTLSNSYLRPAEAFLGIPYALPPTGDRRFKPPEPVGSGDERIDGTSYGYRCPARPLGLFASGWSEDCLTVNVFRPQQEAYTVKLPVAIYIHGGSYNTGAGKYHDSASMMGWSEKPYIAVNFNYRLGALGFLSSTVTAKAGALNLGLHDQRLLLQWVQQNIEAFGGDPDNVTLFGLSAGAHSTGHHIMNHDDISNSFRPLFHRAMLDSGAATSRSVYPYNSTLPKVQFDEFTKEVGCFDMAEEDIMACLRGKPAKTVARASVKIFNRYEDSDRWAFQPVIDGETIKVAPIRAWEAGHWAKIPILTGFNTNEGAPFVDPYMDRSSEFIDFFDALIPKFQDSDLEELDRLYPDPLKYPDSKYKETRPIRVGSQFKRVEAAYGQYAYICPVRQTAHLASAGQDRPVYLYHWALNKTVKGGASHAGQAEYEVYSQYVRRISPAQEKISGYIHAYVTSFITTGDPNAVAGKYADRPFWKPFEAAKSDGKHSIENLMLFGEGNDERAGGSGVGIPAQVSNDTWSAEECEFWSTRSILSES